MNATVLFQELNALALGHQGGYERLKIFCRGRRGDCAVEPVARFETGPGEPERLVGDQAQRRARQRRRLSAFIHVLGYSRWS